MWRLLLVQSSALALTLVPEDTTCGEEHCEEGKCEIQCNLQPGFYCHLERPKGYCCCHGHTKPGTYYNCPGDLVWDPELLACNIAVNVDITKCPNYVPEFDCGNTNCADPPCDIDCHGADPGFYCNLDNPAGFCHCTGRTNLRSTGGKGSYYNECPNGLFFDPDYEQCNLPEFFDKTKCKDFDPCGKEPCQNGGTCVSSNGDFTCIDCDAGYGGKDCGTEDPCKNSPCLNGGTCVRKSDYTTYVCEDCDGGFSGQNCQNEDVCFNNECQNGGSCSPGQGEGGRKYVCDCPAGFLNWNCDEADPCHNNGPCQNGATCAVNGQSYTCSCPAGFIGTDCEDTDPCHNGGPCQNGGTCAVNGQSYTCSCPAGFIGTDCEDTDPCHNGGPCQNGGSCAIDGSSYLCSCPSGFLGVDCENGDPCSNGGPCLNGGTCSASADGSSYTCSCPSGWFGDHCENPTSNPQPCDTAGQCLNGGSCINDADGVNFSCENCDQGWTGPRCEIAFDVCNPDPCQNDATCEDLGNEEYFCRCPTTGEKLYTGENCDIPLYSDGAGAYGDVHLTTYDQGHLNNQGICNYFYTKRCDNSDATIPDFQVIGVQGLHDRDPGTWGVSYVRGMMFHFTPVGSTQRRRFVIRETDPDVIHYYENAVDTDNVRPVQTNENFADLGVAVRTYGDEMVIYWGVGWDFESTSWLDSRRTEITDYLGMVTFTRWEKELKEKNGRFYGGWVMRIDSVLNAALRNKVCGLWGNYNDDQEVDIDVPAGGATNKKHAFWNKVGDLYQTVPSKSCDHIGTECDPAKRATYLAECQKLYDSPFSNCDLDKEQLIDDCVFDLCVTDPDADTELTVCSMMETYVKRCNQKKKKTVTNWRNNNRCSRNCPTNAVYKACGKPECYPVIETTNSDGCDVSGCDASTSCVEGCYCKDGYYQYGSGSKMKCYEEQLIIWTSALNCAAPMCTKNERRQPSQPAEECFGVVTWDQRDFSLGDWGEPFTSVKPSDGVDQTNDNDAYCDVTYTNENFCMPHSYTERVSYVIHRKNGGMTYSEAKTVCTSAGAEMAEIKTNRDRSNLRALYLEEAASKNSAGIRMWVGGQWTTSGGPHELPNDAGARDFGNLLRFSYPNGNPVCYNNFADYSGYQYYYPAEDVADGGFGGLGLGRCLMVGAMFQNGKYRNSMEWTPEKCSYKANYVACQFRCFHNNDQDWHNGG